MLLIRNSQMHVLQDAMWMRLIAEHVCKCFPKQWEEWGEPAARRLIGRAVEKARGYGFKELVDLQQYVDLVVALGEDFETTPEYAWTQGVLADRNPAGAAFRATWLYDSVTQQMADREKHGRRN